MLTSQRDLVAALGQHSFIQQDWPQAFYAPTGFKPASDSKMVVRQWLLLTDQIYFKDRPLSEIIATVKANYLLQLLLAFLSHEDEATRNIRLQAWNFLVSKLVDENISTDKEKCRQLLEQLAADNYDKPRSIAGKKYDAYSLEPYLAEINVANEALNSALCVMNESLQKAFDFLTVKNIDSTVRAIQQIIHDYLLDQVDEESHKKSLTQALLTYVHRDGVMLALYQAQSQNLNSSYYHLDSRVDWARLSIQLICLNDKVDVIAHTPIHAILSNSLQIPSIFVEELEEQQQEEDQHERKYEQQDEKEQLDEQEQEPEANAMVALPNLIENETSASFQITQSSVEIIINHAKSYSCNQQALNVVREKWAQKLIELMNYAKHYVMQREHDEHLQYALFEKYPELKQPKVDASCYLRLCLHSPQPKVMRGNIIFAYLGKNAPEFVADHVATLNFYALAGEDQFIYAIKLLRHLGAVDAAVQAIASYLHHWQYKAEIGNSPYEKTETAVVRKAYQYLIGHAVYLVFELQGNMLFRNATVLTQYPPMLLQFDKAGNPKKLSSGQDLKLNIPLCSKAFLEKPRYLGVVEYIKHKLTNEQYQELGMEVLKRLGVSFNVGNEHFDFTGLPDPDNTILPLVDLSVMPAQASIQRPF